MEAPLASVAFAPVRIQRAHRRTHLSRNTALSYNTIRFSLIEPATRILEYPCMKAISSLSCRALFLKRSGYEQESGKGTREPGVRQSQRAGGQGDWQQDDPGQRRSAEERGQGTSRLGRRQGRNEETLSAVPKPFGGSPASGLPPTLIAQRLQLPALPRRNIMRPAAPGG